jgi:hypothetical protein
MVSSKIDCDAEFRFFWGSHAMAVTWWIITISSLLKVLNGSNTHEALSGDHFQFGLWGGIHSFGSV